MIKVIVATSRRDFLEMCRNLGLDPNKAKYVHINRIDEGITGFYAEDIYPPEYGQDRPHMPKPKAKQTPIWKHEIDCPYCGSHEIIETYSPRPPKHCSKAVCADEHTRTLARERKRRQREREQLSQSNKEA